MKNYSAKMLYMSELKLKMRSKERACFSFSLLVSIRNLIKRSYLQTFPSIVLVYALVSTGGGAAVVVAPGV